MPATFLPLRCHSRRTEILYQSGVRGKPGVISANLGPAFSPCLPPAPATLRPFAIPTLLFPAIPKNFSLLLRSRELLPTS